MIAGLRRDDVEDLAFRPIAVTPRDLGVQGHGIALEVGLVRAKRRRIGLIPVARHLERLQFHHGGRPGLDQAARLGRKLLDALAQGDQRQIGPWLLVPLLFQQIQHGRFQKFGILVFLPQGIQGLETDDLPCPGRKITFVGQLLALFQDDERGILKNVFGQVEIAHDGDNVTQQHAPMHEQ